MHGTFNVMSIIKFAPCKQPQTSSLGSSECATCIGRQLVLKFRLVQRFGRGQETMPTTVTMVAALNTAIAGMAGIKTATAARPVEN